MLEQPPSLPFGPGATLGERAEFSTLTWLTRRWVLSQWSNAIATQAKRVTLCILTLPQGEIRAFGFNEIADRLSPMFEMGKVKVSDVTNC